eukprot:3472226-Amphidinium_carterae.1
MSALCHPSPHSYKSLISPGTTIGLLSVVLLRLEKLLCGFSSFLANQMRHKAAALRQSTHKFHVPQNSVLRLQPSPKKSAPVAVPSQPPPCSLSLPVRR